MRILVVSDGRRGIENQALGLAESVARQATSACEIVRHRPTNNPAFSLLPPRLQLAIKRDFELPDADLVIGCGRQAIAPLLGLRRRAHPVFIVYVQDPRLDPSRFDLVVAPAHDGLSGPYIETMIGSPNRVTRDRIITGTLAEADRLRHLPMPRALFTIGGPSRTHQMGPEVIQTHLSAAKILTDQGYSLLVTTSRRTPETARNAWGDFEKETKAIWLHTPESESQNPYFAFLGAADILLVTEDSTNMLTEACVTGKPVYRLPMDGNSGTFQQLYDALETRCGVRRWDGQLDTKPYPALDETARIAERILERMR